VDWGRLTLKVAKREEPACGGRAGEWEGNISFRYQLAFLNSRGGSKGG